MQPTPPSIEPIQPQELSLEPAPLPSICQRLIDLIKAILQAIWGCLSTNPSPNLQNRASPQTSAPFGSDAWFKQRDAQFDAQMARMEEELSTVLFEGKVPDMIQQNASAVPVTRTRREDRPPPATASTRTPSKAEDTTPLPPTFDEFLKTQPDLDAHFKADGVVKFRFYYGTDGCTFKDLPNHTEANCKTLYEEAVRNYDAHIKSNSKEKYLVIMVFFVEGAKKPLASIVKSLMPRI